MKAIFTVCTFNHIARAFSLADSVQEYCPHTRFLIGIIGNIDKEIKSKYDIVRAGEMGIPFLDEMYRKYSPLELNSALKPYFANFIFQQFDTIDQLVFLDSDILLFSDLHPVYQQLEQNSIVLTPHSLSTVSEGTDFDDRVFLRSGIYNAGFFGLKRDQYAFTFLTWWMAKLRDQCFFDSKRGMFAEQLWLNLVPLYFERVSVLRHPGCNVSYWNLHEREISVTDGRYYVNGSFELIFYHYSGASVDCLAKNSVSEHQKRYTFTNRPDVEPLFRLYVDSLIRHSFEKYDQYYTINDRLKTRSVLIRSLVEWYKRGIKKLSSWK
jgi:hypothetical protein